MKNEKILIVEDEMVISALIEETLHKIGFSNIEMADSAGRATELMTANDYDIVLMDIKLGRGTDGIDVVNSVQEKKPVPVIYVSGNSDNKTVNKAKATMPYGFLTKPISENDLRIQIDLLLYKEGIKKQDEEELRQKTNLYDSSCTGLQLTLNLDGGILAASPHIARITGKPAYMYTNKTIGNAGFDRQFYTLLNSMLYLVKNSEQREFYRTVNSPYIGERPVRVDVVANGFFSFQFRFTDLSEKTRSAYLKDSNREIAIASDNKEILQGFRALPFLLSDFHLAAELQSEEAIGQYLKAGKNGILVLDTDMPGIQNLLKRAQEFSAIRKLLLVSVTGNEQLDNIPSALYDGYISKTASDATIQEAIEALRSGKHFYDPALAAVR